MAVAYHSHDFEWEHVRATALQELQAQAGEGGARPCGSKEASVYAPAAWEEFHKRHATARFFKERRYLPVEFPELTGSGARGLPLAVLEVGCGSGCSVLPVLRANPSALVVGVDCSPAAVAHACAAVEAALGPTEAVRRFRALVCDVGKEDLEEVLAKSGTASWLHMQRTAEHALPGSFPCLAEAEPSEAWGVVGSGEDGSAGRGSGAAAVQVFDAATMVFTLSAVPPARMATVLGNVHAALRPGGCVLFRDYGLYDMAMLRFPSSRQLEPCLYAREDGTLAYFFSREALEALAAAQGFMQVASEYCCVELQHRRRKVSMARVWLHAKLLKPASPS